MSLPELYECPYKKYSKCSTIDSCMGCEVLSENIREHGINGHPIPYIWVLPARAPGEIDRDFAERVKEYMSTLSSNPHTG